jgi:hypothetical protein
MKKLCCCLFLSIFFFSCSVRQKEWDEQSQSLTKAIESLGKEKLTTATTHVMIVTLQGCGGCTSQVLAHYKEIVTPRWLVVFCANERVIVRSLLSEHGIDGSDVLVDTKNSMVKNRLVDHSPVVFRVNDKQIVERYDLDLENFTNSIARIKNDSQ